jgi:hypothetical protein
MRLLRIRCSPKVTAVLMTASTTTFIAATVPSDKHEVLPAAHWQEKYVVGATRFLRARYRLRLAPRAIIQVINRKPPTETSAENARPMATTPMRRRRRVLSGTSVRYGANLSNGS